MNIWVQSQTAVLLLIRMLTPSTENANQDYTACTSWETLALTPRVCKCTKSAVLSSCSQFRSCAGMEACVFEVSVFWVMWWMYVVKLWVWNKWECKNYTNDKLWRKQDRLTGTQIHTRTHTRAHTHTHWRSVSHNLVWLKLFWQGTVIVVALYLSVV